MANSGTFTKGGRIWRYETSPQGNIKGIFYETNVTEYNRVKNKTYTIYTNPGGSNAPSSQQTTENVTGERYTGTENGKYYVQTSFYEKQPDGSWAYKPSPPGLEDANGNLAQAQAIGNDNTLKTQITQTQSPNTSSTDPNQPGAPGGSTPANPNTPEEPGNEQSPSGILVYPISRPDTLDYLQVTSIKYVSGGLPGAGTFATTPVGKRMTERGTTIWLPMQPSITDNNAVSWNPDELNPFQARLANTAYNAIKNIGSAQLKQALTQFAGDVKDFAQDVASASGLPNYVRAYFAGQAAGGANIIGRQTGAVLNNNLELLFQGPTLRTFQYNYRFTPRDPGESIVVKNIIKTLKVEMAVDNTAGNGIFLSSPNVFELKYFFGATKEEHPFLNKIKLCALTNLSVDYTPDGSYMTFDDGSMTSYNVSMQFSELEPIYKKDQVEASSVMGY
jgi:hypothetical protein